MDCEEKSEGLQFEKLYLKHDTKVNNTTPDFLSCGGENKVVLVSEISFYVCLAIIGII